MEKLVNKSCEEFTEVLYSKAPVPGGGGAAALCGALGVSLCAMAGNLTLGRKKYIDVEDDIKRMLKDAEDIRLKLLELVDEDAACFEPLQKAYSIPKDDPNRDATLQEVSILASQAPLEMMRQIAKSVELMEEMLVKGSVMLMSDVGCGACLAEASLKAASLNIYVNTKSLKCEEAIAIEKEADSLLEEYSKRAKAVSDEVLQRLHR